MSRRRGEPKDGERSSTYSKLSRLRDLSFERVARNLAEESAGMKGMDELDPYLSFEDVNLRRGPADERPVGVHGARVGLPRTSASRELLAGEIREHAAGARVAVDSGGEREPVQRLVCDGADVA